MKKMNNLNRYLRLSIPLILLAVCMILLFAGCGKPYPKEPSDVMMAFYEAVGEQDFNGAKRYCTKNYLGNDFNASDAMKSLSGLTDLPAVSAEDKKEAKEAMQKMMQELIQNGFQSEISGDRAKVWPSGMPFTKTVMVKEGGKWKIDGVEMDFDPEEMMKQFGNLGQ